MIWIVLTVVALVGLLAALFGGVGGMTLALLVVVTAGAGWLLVHMWRRRSITRL
jgi:hypothetical protein